MRRSVRRLRVIAFFTLLLSHTPCAGVLSLDVRKQDYFTHLDFKRIPEFFTGREYAGSKVYCRTNPETRDGFYFVVKISGDQEELPQNPFWVVDWVSSLNPVPQSKSLAFKESKVLGPEIFLGLTGKDWPDSSAKVLAWRIRLTNENGLTAASTQSFLWSK